MASGKPIVRQVAWIALLPQMLFMGLLIFLYWLALRSFYLALYLGAVTYLLIGIGLHFGVSRHHRKGILLYKAGQYAQAIAAYEKSYRFFTEHAWVDKYRYITLLSASRISYTEMALLNMAFCHAQLGDGAAAKQYYQRTLELFPNSEMAKQALNLIAALEAQGTA